MKHKAQKLESKKKVDYSTPKTNMTIRKKFLQIPILCDAGPHIYGFIITKGSLIFISGSRNTLTSVVT